MLLDQLDQYIIVDADLIPLHFWNKQTKRGGRIQERGKTPLNSEWTKQPKNPAVALKMAKDGYNVGYRLSATELVIDVDPRKFGDTNSLAKLFEFLNVDDLANHYPTVRTGGGGYHYYMTKPAELNCIETIDKFPGIEFKTAGRQVVAAGSRHPNGEHYVWDDFCPQLGSQNFEAPSRLLKLVERSYSTHQNPGDINNDQLSELLAQLPVTDFKEHEKWFAIMCSAHHGTVGAGIEEFLDWSLGDVDYVGDEHMIRQRWASLGGKSLNYTINTLYKTVLTYGGKTDVSAELAFRDVEIDDFSDIVGTPKLDKSMEPGLATRIANQLEPDSSEEALVQAIRAALQAGTIEQIKSLKIIQSKSKMSKGELNEVIKCIREQILDDLGRVLAEKTLELNFNHGEGLVMNNNGQFWAYNGTHWTTVTRQYVGRHITQVLDNLRAQIDIKIKENTIVSEALSILERITATRHDALRLREKPYPVINFKNGELWIESDGTSALRPHKPKSFLLQTLPVDYSPGSECPLFDKSIREIFGDYADCEDIVRHFEEFMGYVLHPDKRPAHFWLLKGPGGDGKTTLMKILSSLLGDAVMPESIERFKGGMVGDRHAMAELIGVSLVYDDDLNRNTILPDGTLKKLSEDGELTANPKGEQGFKFTKICTVAMCSNGYPKTGDVTRGFRRRAMVIPFSKGFHESDQEIVNLADQITSNERAGVMNRALQGLIRLRTRGKFSEPMSCRLAREEWLHESNPVAFYINEQLEITKNNDDFISLTDCYRNFSEFCVNYNVKRICTKQEFRAAMEDMGIVYSKVGGNKNVFRGVRISSSSDDFEGFY